MAKLFLSYSREDARRVTALAKALEAAGHEVWWDRHIDGGSRFAREIDAALKQCEVVVVLWSRSSVDSAWVQDEAAAGRDTNRIVPVLIENVEPPLGFRQYQSIDLSTWSARRKVPAPLLSAISAKALGSSSTSAASRVVAKNRFSQPWRLAAVVFSLMFIAAALFGGWRYFTSGFSASAATPTVAVLPFADLSPRGDKGYLGDGIADVILTSLAREPGVSVIGRSSAAQFRGRPDDLRNMRKAFGVTHILEGSTQAIGDRLRMSVRLIDASSGKDIWAQDYRRDMTKIFEIQDEIAQAVTRQLKGSIAEGGKAHSRQRTAIDTYALYLAARAKMRERQPQSLREAFDLARQVIAADPNYGPGQALYADAVTLLADTSYGQIPAQKALQIASSHARDAIRLAPDSADGYAALGGAWAQIDGSRAIGPLEKAIGLDPSRAEVRQWLGAAYNEIGRNTEAERNYRLAVDVDPLLRSAVWRLTVVYAASGDYDRAEGVANNYLRRGGSKAWVNILRGEIARYRGHLASAARHFQAAVRERSDLRLAATRLASTYSDLGLYNSAQPFVRQEKPLVRALVMNSEDAVALVRSAPEGIWYGDDLELAVEYLGKARNWPLIAKLYDMPTGVRGRACRLPLAAITIAIAMREVGRSEEASRLIICATRTITIQQQGSYRNEFLPIGTLHFAKAQLLGIQRNPNATFAELRRAADTGFRIPLGCGLNCFAAFDDFRAQTDYSAVDRHFKQLALVEQGKLLASN